MAELHVHLEGPSVDHPEWTLVRTDDDFDASALERAMTEARQATYAELRDLDAA